MGNRFKRQAKRHGQRLPHLMPVKAATPESKDGPTGHEEIGLDQLKAIIERTATGPLDEQDRQLLLSVSETLCYVTDQLERKSISIARLRKLLFGASTETLKNLEDQHATDSQDQEQPSAEEPTEPKTKAKGHGRNGAEDYTGAQKVNIPHETLKPGDPCPHCLKGTVYEMAKPKSVVRVTGQAPLQATVYELQKLRCGLCGKIFTAKAPDGMCTEKYDAESVSMMAMLKYGSGVPFNRLERLQETLGIPLAASTQWETLSEHEYVFGLVYDAFIVAAAQGKVIHNDDTVMKVLNLTDLNRPDKEGRTGVFTSGIVSVGDDHQIALFFTGHKHAGENLADVLRHRVAELTAPIQMSDGLSRNVPGEFETLLANCLAHGRRKFVDVYDDFPAECHHVLDRLAQVYKNEADTQAQSDADRLIYHQQHSGPIMAELKDWMQQQLDDHLVEPNSSLGDVIGYMLKHWEPLTLFLREPGSPLDNNLCERALKKAILHRKNAYFYKTANGARVGDMFMSLIHTCELNAINPFNYLTELQKHAAAVALCPANWLPWNYQQALSQELAASEA
jgi:transposase